MIKLVLCVWVLIHQVAGYTVDDADSLFQNISSAYRKHFRPLYDQSKTLPVYAYFDLVSFHEFDEVQEKFTVTGILYLEWIDEFYQWNPNDFGGTQTLTVHLSEVWTPTVLHVNSAEKVEQLSEDWQLLRVNSSGYVSYYFGNVFTSSCTINIAHYPFDTQQCSLDFFFVGYVYNEIQFIPATTKILTGLYGDNGAWDLTDTSVSVQYGGSSVSFILSLRRKSLYVVINVICPLVLMSFLNFLVFFIPAKSGGRISFCVTVLLSVAVLLTLVGNNLPKTSNPMALYSYYLISVLVISMCITIVTIVSENFYHTSTDVPVSARWQSFVLCFLCRRRRNHYSYKNGTHMSPKTAEFTMIGNSHAPEQNKYPAARRPEGRRREKSDVHIIGTALPYPYGNHNQTVYLNKKAEVETRELDSENKRITWNDVSTAIDRFAFVFFLIVVVVDTAVFTFAIS